MIHELYERLQTDGVLTLHVRVRPNAPATQFVSFMADDSLKIDLAAPADDGKANRALVELLSDTFRVPPLNVRILSGMTGRKKLVRLRL